MRYVDFAVGANRPVGDEPDLERHDEKVKKFYHIGTARKRCDPVSIIEDLYSRNRLPGQGSLAL